MESNELSKQAVVDKYLELFTGRDDVFAIYHEYPLGETVRRAYFPSIDQDDNGNPGPGQRLALQKVGITKFTAEAVKAHFSGKAFLGAYPMRPDSTIAFFVLDFDGKKGDPWTAVLSQQKILREEAGIETYIERSRSGNGYHLWGFLEEPVSAAKVRHALGQFIPERGVFDRMIPMQDEVSSTLPYGNLIALPLAGENVVRGNTIFVEPALDGTPQPVQDQKKFLFDIKKIRVEDVYSLYAKAPPPTTQRARPRLEEAEGLSGSFKVIHPVYGCEWVRWCYEHPTEVDEPTWYALACQFAQLKDGRKLFHKWSAQDRDRYDYVATDKKFEHALRENKPHSCETLRTTVSGPPCSCDERFPNLVFHPYDLAKIPIKVLFEAVDNIARTGEHIESAAQGITKVVEWVERVEKNPEEGMGIPTGMPELDKHMGLRDGDLITFAARPGMGKSGWMIDLAYRLAIRDIPVYLFSVEMTKEQLWRRLMARGAQINLLKTMRGELSRDEWQVVRSFSADLVKNPIPIYVDDFSNTVHSIAEMSGELMSRHGKGIIMIDYLQLIQGHKGESDFERVSRVVTELKRLAKVFHTNIISLTQLSRAADEIQDDVEPSLSWLRSTGQIEQDSDIVMFMLGSRGLGIKRRVFWKLKDRFAESGIKIEMDFNQPIMTFESVNKWSHFGDIVEGDVEAAKAAFNTDEFGEELPWA